MNLRCFRPDTNYEKLAYNLPATSTHIKFSTLVLKRRGKYNCWLVGTIFFHQSIRLEIAEALDLPLGTVKSRLNRARIDLATAVTRRLQIRVVPPTEGPIEGEA